VFRPEEEVFSPETIASFEGMPVTDDHPRTEAGVTLENCRWLQKGHAQNVRRGSGAESDLLLADLMITDKRLIDEILQENKREVSCGYTYELSMENGQYTQRKIRGNHVAVVDAGRAGPRVSIRDRHPEIRSLIRRIPGTRDKRFKHILPTDHERRPWKMKKNLYRKLVRMARDGDPEAMEAVAEIVESLSETEAEAAEALAAAAMGASGAAPAAAAVPALGMSAAVPAPAAAVPALGMSAAVPAPAAAVPAMGVPAAGMSGDCDINLEILQRLDQVISLLSSGAQGGSGAAAGAPGATDEASDRPEDEPRADDDPLSEIAQAVEGVVEEAVEEAVQAAEAGELSERVLDEEGSEEALAEEIAAIIQEITEPSAVLEPEAQDDIDPTRSQDASRIVRRALRKVKPTLSKLPRSQRDRARREIAARIRGMARYNRKASDALSDLSAYSSGRGAQASDPAALGKRIMASRNANMKNR